MATAHIGHEGMLDVGDGHQLWWSESGAPDGTPAVYLHGGPGSGTGAFGARLFDPQVFRGVLFDQRGCGRSRPLAVDHTADLATNTTDHLVADIEALRQHLAIDRWIVVGVSWGATLALVYAQRHPERVRGIVLGAVTSGTPREIEWITRDMGRVFPAEWDAFVGGLPESDRAGNLSAAYARLLADPDPVVRDEAARRWCAWEDTHVSLMPGWEPDPRFDDPTFRQVFARLVTHYWGNDCFLGDGEILDGMDRIAHVPGVMVHGRHDVSGPLEVPYRLHQRWPASRLVVVDDAGHGGGGFVDELVAGVTSMRELEC
jgi:proline iminopeptidase